jgi:hypothetical protein
LAIANVRRWLTKIMLGPRMPTRKLRQDARRLLKHYPTDLDMEDPKSIFGGSLAEDDRQARLCSLCHRPMTGDREDWQKCAMCNGYICDDCMGRVGAAYAMPVSQEVWCASCVYAMPPNPEPSGPSASAESLGEHHKGKP